MVSETKILKFFPNKSMETLDHLGWASLDPRDIVGGR